MRSDTESYYVIIAVVVVSLAAMLSIYARFMWGFSLLAVAIVVLVYFFMIVGITIRTLFLILIGRTARKLRFRIITGFFDQPRMVGRYRHMLFQLHFREKETGKFPGVFRTYVKLIFREPKKFNDKSLRKVDEYIESIKIFRVKHINRDDKNYLLMKAAGFIFDRKKLHMLMDELIKISEKTEVQ